jgi:two-component system phosphate regulon sensor histidine kinase PhoR
VDVHIDRFDKSAVIEVADDGIGIPESEKERIFERFYRVDKSRSKEVGGTGLGLSIVKHAAMIHDADIEVESDEGKGTTINVTIPLESNGGER